MRGQCFVRAVRVLSSAVVLMLSAAVPTSHPSFGFLPPIYPLGVLTMRATFHHVVGHLLFAVVVVGSLYAAELYRLDH